MRNVFLSSTSRDLFEYREAVTKAVHGLDGYHCVRMEDFGARDQQALEFCRSKVRECDLFIGILGLLYGSCPEGAVVSYTEDEYDTATQSGISRLMFVSAEDFNVPGRLRESDEMWRRQQTFRTRVNKDPIRATFKDPDELAGAVVSAIHNWELQRQSGGNRQRRTSRRHGANLGELVPRMCDRAPQEGSFHLFFSEQIKRRPGFPQIYLIHGSKVECHASLVERLRWTHLKDYARHKWREKRGVVGGKKFTDNDWPHEGDLADRRRLLLAKLFKEFDHNYEFVSDDFSAAAFARLTAKKLEPVIALSHEVRTAQWDRATGELLESYLRFWDEVSLHNPQPQFIIFLLVIYPQTEAPGFLKSLLRLSRFDKKTIERELNGIFLPRLETLKQEKLVCPSLMLKELACVVRDDVMNWFSHNGIYDDLKTQREKCDELFKESDCRHMDDIEHQLKLIHKEFKKEFQQKGGLV